MTIEASETDLAIADVPESEVFPVEEFGEFRVRLCNSVVSDGGLEKNSAFDIPHSKALDLCVKQGLNSRN